MSRRSSRSGRPASRQQMHRVGPSGALRRAISETLENRLLLSTALPQAGPPQNLLAEGPVEVDLRASDLSAGSASSWINDGAMGGSLSAVGTPTVAATPDAGGITFNAVQFSGTGQAFTTGTAPAPVDLTGAAPRSIEVWVLNPTIDGVEETMVSWSHRGGPDGTNESFSYGSTYGVGQWGGGFDSTWAGQAAPGAPGTAPVANLWHYMVYTYDGNVNNVYVDGQLWTTHTIGALATGGTDPISIAAQNTAATPASAIFGKLDVASVRISSGALTSSDIANNYAQGVPGQSSPVDHAPAAPTNVSATAVLSSGSYAAKVSFQDNADNETEFQVLRAGSASGPFVQIATIPAVAGSGTVSTYTDAGVVLGQTYYYEVASYNAFNGGTSSVSSASAPLTIPTSTQNLVAEGAVEVDLRASDLSAGSTTTWNNDGAAGGSFTLPAAITVGPNVEGSPDAGGVAFQSVQFNGAQSLVSGFTAPADLTGAAPRSMEVWVLNPSFNGGEETMVGWSHRGGPDGTNESFSYGSTYGVGQWGGGYDSTWGGNAAPGAPGTAPTANVWHYMVYTYDGNVNNVYVDGKLVITHTIGALNTGAADPISVAAQNQTGNPGSASFGNLDIASIRLSSGALTTADIAHNFAQGVPGQSVAPDHAPAAPSNLTATPGASSIALSFKDNADNETQFQVLRATSASGPFTQIGTLPASPGTGSTVTFTDPRAQPGTTYYYEVAAFNAFNGGTATASSAVSAVIPAPVAGTNYWPLDEGTGTTVADTIGGNTGTLVGAAPPTFVPGQSGQPGDFGLNFTGANAPEFQSINTGTNGLVQLQNSLTPVLGGTSTLTAWVKTTQVSATGNHWSSPAITGCEVPGPDWDISWGFLDQTGHIGVAEGDAAGDIAKSSTAINDGQWHFVAMTRNAQTGTVQVFVDGTLQGQTTGTDAQATQIKTGYFGVLGAQTDVNDASGSAASAAGYIFFNGSLDDVHVFNRVISQTEVAALYAGPQTHAPAAPSNFTAAANGGNVTLSWKDNADNEVGFVIDRATGASGPWVQVTTLGRVTGTGGTGTYVDKNLAPGTYYYRIRAVNGFNSGVESANVPSGAVTIPATIANGVELHVYNQAFWAGPVAFSTVLPNMDFVASGTSPVPQYVHGNENSMIFTGKVKADTSGLYTFVSNTSEDGYLYVDGLLVSEDPGVHGPRDAGTLDSGGNPIGAVFPISLAAGQSYDFVLLESNQSSVPVAHLEWITPTNTTGTPVVIPQDHLTPVSDAPSVPTGLAPASTFPPDQVTPSHAVDLTFNTTNNATVQYLLQRSSDNGTTWQTVGQRDPGGAFNNFDGTTSPVTLTIEDAMPVPGATYQYRVMAFNYDHTSLSTTPSTLTVTVPPNPSTPQLGVEAHYFKGTLLGSGNPQLIGTPPAEFALVSSIDFNFDNFTPTDTPDGQLFPDIPRIGHTDWSIMYTGKIRTDQAGTYTFITNTDDDGYLWVNDQLVSSDPGGHGQRNATNLTPISLAANTDYDFIMVQSQALFGAGAHLSWIEPGQTTPTLVGNFDSAVSDIPATPTGLTATSGSANLGTGVSLTWTDTSPSETGCTVERATDAGFTQNVSVIGAAGFDTTGFTDTTAQPGTTYFYRLRAFNWDGVSGNSNVASAAGAVSGTFVGTAATDNWYVREDADHQHVEIYLNNTGTGTPIQVPITGTPGLSFQGLAGDDSLTIDYGNGDPNLPNGISFDGGDGTDTLNVIGSSASDASGLTAASLSRGTNATAVSFSNLENENLQVGTFNVTGSQTLGNLTLGGGAKLSVAHGATPATLDVQSLSIASGGSLDLNNNSLLVHYTGASPAAAIRQWLVRGYNGGAWNGSGILSSDAASHSGNTLGFADSADGVVSGQTANTVLVKYTRVGDVNLDGSVAFADLLALAQHYGQVTNNWDQGDVNYDGSVAFSDLLALAQNYGQKTSSAAAPAAAAASAPLTPVLDTLATSSKKTRRRL